MKQLLYKTARHPKTGKLWVMGYCGGGKYMAMYEVSNQTQADELIKRDLMALKAEKNEINNWNLK